MTLSSIYNTTWDGWRLLADNHEVGHIAPDLANGYQVHFSGDRPDIGWTAVTADTATEAAELLKDYWHALTDLVDRDELSYQGKGQFAATPVMWNLGMTK